MIDSPISFSVFELIVCAEGPNRPATHFVPKNSPHAFQRPGSVQPASWEGLLPVVWAGYGEKLGAIVARHVPSLREKSFADVQVCARHAFGMRFSVCWACARLRGLP